MSNHVRTIRREIASSFPKLRVATNPTLFRTLQQVVVEPLDGLEESLLLGEPLRLVGQIAPDREAVNGAAVQVDLVGLAGLLEDLFRLVAQLRGEDLVGLGGSDGPRASDGGELLLVDEGRVGDKTDLDAVLVVAGNVLSWS